MKSAILLGLTGLAANVHAHPAPKLETASGLAKRGIDISKYSLPSLSDYTPSTHVEEEASIQAEGFKRDYVATATRAVKRAAPNAEFRVVPDHYIDVDGIGHVHFKQTAHGIDIDNADFKVNVSEMNKDPLPWSNWIEAYLSMSCFRLAEMAESSLTETASSLARFPQRAP